MDVLNNLLFWLHFVGLGLGALASIGLPVVIGAQMRGAPPEARPVLLGVAGRLARMGQMGFGLLLVTGPLLFWLKWNGSAPSAAWFGAKMILVLALFITVIVSSLNSRRMQNGDAAAAKRQPMVGMTGLVLFLGVILTAVFAFN